MVFCVDKAGLIARREKRLEAMREVIKEGYNGTMDFVRKLEARGIKCNMRTFYKDLRRLDGVNSTQIFETDSALLNMVEGKISQLEHIVEKSDDPDVKIRAIKAIGDLAKVLASIRKDVYLRREKDASLGRGVKSISFGDVEVVTDGDEVVTDGDEVVTGGDGSVSVKEGVDGVD